MLACAALLFVLSGVSAPAQDGGGMEEFDRVDPYTGGKKECMKKLGYVSFGPFLWRDGDSTLAVQEHMGGIPMLFVETEHFRIGSSLGTYKLPGDRVEKALLEQELGRLKARLGKLKPPKRELDPWLRLHLYAQRAEELYASFVEEFELGPGDYGEQGPYLGQRDKHLLLLCQRKSEFVRHMRTYLDVGVDHAYRWSWGGQGMFFGINLESLRADWDSPAGKPFDLMLHCRMVAALTKNFVDGYRGCNFGAPAWLGIALGHVNVRRIDPRWGSATGYQAGRGRREKDHKWRPRIANLVKNDFFATTDDMFAWQAYEDLNTRDHMIAWSRLDYLLSVADGDPKGFLTDLCRPAPTGAPEVRRAEMAARQTKALGEHFGLLPAELDDAWARWVKKTYRKR